MKILTTPWKRELLELVANSRDSIKITSPFVKENICTDVFAAKQSQTSFQLITTFKLANVFHGSLDLAAMALILKNDGTVKNYPKLHSKIYLFDDSQAVITSSNLTNGGLVNNYEYGVLINDLSSVKKISDDFQALSSDEKIGIVKQSDLDYAAKILANVPKVETLKLPKYQIETPEQTFDVLETTGESIAQMLNGWKRDVFDCVNQIAAPEFELSDVYLFEDYLHSKHPQNMNIKDKIRQQLQNLRDLGLIEFKGAGQYRKLWR